MSLNPSSVANYFLHKAGFGKRAIKHLKLQKLLYYAHGHHLAMTGKPLLNESFQAWKHGPVIVSVYDQLSHYRKDPIREELTPKEGEYEKIKEADQCRFLDKIWNEYSHLNAFDLSEMTHEEGSPWDRAKKQFGHAAKYVPIDDEFIEENFIEIDAQLWDKEIQADYKSGKLDQLREKALSDYRSGNFQEL